MSWTVQFTLHDLLSVKSGVFKLLSCSHHMTERGWSATGCTRYM